MKKSLLLALALCLASLAVFGLGCRNTSQSRVAALDTLRSRESQDTSKTAGIKQSTTTDIVTDDEVPVLAYLQFTKDSAVKVSRGDELRDGVQNMELIAGDEVEVITGEARLMYPETGISILKQGSKIVIMPSKNAGDGFADQILLEAGEIWTRLERTFGANEDFSVEANEVVAAVRGTGFGVSLANGEVNITVADHQVNVTTRAALKTAKDTGREVVLAAGNSINIKPGDLKTPSDPRAELLKHIAKVSDTNKRSLFYRFALRKIEATEIQRPILPFKWSAPIKINSILQDRLTPEQLRRLKNIILRQTELRPQLLDVERLFLLREATSVQFAPPLRDILPLEMTPTATPSSVGPAI